jgi:hypothetical protein
MEESIVETCERRRREAEEWCDEVLCRAMAAYFALTPEQQREADLRALKMLVP